MLQLKQLIINSNGLQQYSLKELKNIANKESAIEQSVIDGRISTTEETELHTLQRKQSSHIQTG